MIRKGIEELKGNEILAKPIMTWDYQIILPEGAVIRKDYIDKLLELGILSDIPESNQLSLFDF